MSENKAEATVKILDGKGYLEEVGKLIQSVTPERRVLDIFVMPHDVVASLMLVDSVRMVSHIQKDEVNETQVELTGGAPTGDYCILMPGFVYDIIERDELKISCQSIRIWGVRVCQLGVVHK